MVNQKRSLSIKAYLFISMGCLFLLCFIAVIFLVNNSMRQLALKEAESKAKLILDHNLATHFYFNKTLKPKLFDLTKPIISEDYFDPSWMSSTFAIRQIEKNFKKITSLDYYYKECAINARTPENEADSYERIFLNRLNINPNLKRDSSIRRYDSKPYFIVMRRGENMEQNCMICHSEPAKAPQGMVDLYGSDKSFYRNVGDVVSAISIRIPLASAYMDANRFSLQLTMLLVGMLALLFGVQFWFFKQYIYNPLETIRNKAIQISEDEKQLGDKMPLPLSKELQEVTIAFNTMSQNLRDNIDNLEEKVEKRTVDLNKTVILLNKEIEERKQVEEKREKLLKEVQEALTKVKTLSGMLPICASCKKIRDDKGYWTQIEEYVRDHSEAEFTHGICPECAKKLYPDLY